MRESRRLPLSGSFYVSEHPLQLFFRQIPAIQNAGGKIAGTPEALAERAWLDGVLASLRAETTALQRARGALHESGSAFTSVLGSSLAAFEQYARGDHRAAAAALVALEHQCRARVTHALRRRPSFLAGCSPHRHEPVVAGER